MIYYAIVAVFPLIMWALNDYLVKTKQLDEVKEKKLKRNTFFLALLPLFLLFVLRDKTIRTDTIGYVRFFLDEIRQFSFADLLIEETMRQEIGYRLYVKIISLFTTNYTVYFLINGLVIFGAIYHFAIKHTKNPYLLVFLFVTLGTYGFIETGLRQSLAMAICLFAVDFLKDRKLIRFYLLVVLAYFFHKSALVFALIYPLCAIKDYKWSAIVYTILTVVFVLGFTVFQEIVNELLGYNYGVESTDSGFIFLVLLTGIFIYSAFTHFDHRDELKNDSTIFHLAMFTLILWVLRLISRTAERVSYYFIFGIYGYFSNTYDLGSDKISVIIKWLLVIVCFALFVYRNVGINYLFFWQGA